MRKLSHTLLFVIASLFSPIAAAGGDGPVVVELFTSQGCSSCPPADKLLARLARRSDVIALAFHVDYWDYIGWKDIFADPTHGERQRAYARQGGRPMVYTPQMIIGGAAHVEGARPMDVMDGIVDAEKWGANVNLRLALRHDLLTIRADALVLEQPVSVHLVRFIPSQSVEIRRGENRGLTLGYSNIVTSLDRLRDWGGTKPLDAQIRTDGDEGIAVILQYPGPGRIIAAAKID